MSADKAENGPDAPAPSGGRVKRQASAAVRQAVAAACGKSQVRVRQGVGAASFRAAHMAQTPCRGEAARVGASALGAGLRAYQLNNLHCPETGRLT
jgi:hypothetical protein